jgi:hypothetical protein
MRRRAAFSSFLPPLPHTPIRMIGVRASAPSTPPAWREPPAGKPFVYHFAKRACLQKRFSVLVYVAGRGAQTPRHTMPQRPPLPQRPHKAVRPANDAVARGTASGTGTIAFAAEDANNR